jgi:hypothetical protein
MLRYSSTSSAPARYTIATNFYLNVYSMYRFMVGVRLHNTQYSIPISVIMSQWECGFKVGLLTLTSASVSSLTGPYATRVYVPRGVFILTGWFSASLCKDIFCYSATRMRVDHFLCGVAFHCRLSLPSLAASPAVAHDVLCIGIHSITEL